MFDKNLYDFDKTVYPTNSMVEFWGYCIRKHPKVLLYSPVQLFACIHLGIQKLRGKEDYKLFKERFFSYIRIIDAEKCSEGFWEEHIHRIYDWFLPENRQMKTVVCSGSCEFFLKPVCDKLGVDYLIGTKMDPKTAKIDGPNCRSEEKAKRLKVHFKENTFYSVYSDALINDAPILALGKHKFLTNTIFFIT